jgi:hypothetical protein
MVSSSKSTCGVLNNVVHVWFVVLSNSMNPTLVSILEQRSSRILHFNSTSTFIWTLEQQCSQILHYCLILERRRSRILHFIPILLSSDLGTTTFPDSTLCSHTTIVWSWNDDIPGFYTLFPYYYRLNFGTTTFPDSTLFSHTTIVWTLEQWRSRILYFVPILLSSELWNDDVPGLHSKIQTIVQTSERRHSWVVFEYVQDVYCETFPFPVASDNKLGAVEGNHQNSARTGIPLGSNQ